MFFADELEFVRNVYRRNGISVPQDPQIDLDYFVDPEFTGEPEVELSDSVVNKLRWMSKIGQNEICVYTPGYATKSGKKVRGYFRTVKTK